MRDRLVPTLEHTLEPNAKTVRIEGTNAAARCRRFWPDDKACIVEETWRVGPSYATLRFAGALAAAIAHVASRGATAVGAGAETEPPTLCSGGG